MTGPNLSENAWQRAVQASARLCKTTAFGVAATLMTIIFGSVAAVVSAGQDTTTQIAAPILGGALALALTFATLFAVQLAAAPVRQRNELREAWDSDEPGRPIDIELILRNERRKASDFYRIQQGRAVTTAVNRIAAEEWTNRVVELLTEYVDADAARKFIESSRGITAFS